MRKSESLGRENDRHATVIRIHDHPQRVKRSDEINDRSQSVTTNQMTMTVNSKSLAAGRKERQTRQKEKQYTQEILWQAATLRRHLAPRKIHRHPKGTGRSLLSS